jgi:hypothetical protein
MAPITRASGTRRMVLARPARNRRLANALYWQAFAALADRRERGPTTTPRAPAAPPTTRPCAPSPTGWSASCTAACATTPARTKPSPGTATPPLRRQPLDGLGPWDVWSRLIRKSQVTGHATAPRRTGRKVRPQGCPSTGDFRIRRPLRRPPRLRPIRRSGPTLPGGSLRR